MKKAAFTLVELIVVIGIIAMLATLTTAGARAAIDHAHAVQCRNNLRQMAIAANLYALDNRDYLPPAYARDYNTYTTTSWETFLWEYDARRSANDSNLHQCPSFRGNAMWSGDRYTGYNYNSSYLGGVRAIFDGKIEPDSQLSARLSHVKDPSNCAMFGDGQYESGANKFMRSPFPGPQDAGAGAALGGTQGFRHRGATNVAFVDGSVRALKDCFTESANPYGKPVKNCGFLSKDNSLYDLD